jgi:hypothetical protein
MITIHRTRITRVGVTRLKILQTTTVAGEIQLRLQHQMTIILEVRKIQIQQLLRPPTITIQQAGEVTKTQTQATVAGEVRLKILLQMILTLEVRGIQIQLRLHPRVTIQQAAGDRTTIRRRALTTTTHGETIRALALMVMVPGAINRIRALKTIQRGTNRALALTVMVPGAINRIRALKTTHGETNRTLALETTITHGVTGLSLASLGRVREVITSQTIHLRVGRILPETILPAVQTIARTTNGARQRILHHGEICLLLRVKVEMRIIVDGIIMEVVDLEGRMVGVVIAVEAMHLEEMIMVVGTTVEATDLEEITAGVEAILVIPGHRGEQRLQCLREVGEMMGLGLQEVQAGEGA